MFPVSNGKYFGFGYFYVATAPDGLIWQENFLVISVFIVEHISFEL